MSVKQPTGERERERKKGDLAYQLSPTSDAPTDSPATCSRRGHSRRAAEGRRKETNEDVPGRRRVVYWFYWCIYRPRAEGGSAINGKSMDGEGCHPGPSA